MSQSQKKTEPIYSGVCWCLRWAKSIKVEPLKDGKVLVSFHCKKCGRQWKEVRKAKK